MIQAMHIKYATPHPYYQSYGGRIHYGGKHNFIERGGCGYQHQKTGEEVVDAMDTVVLTTTVGNMICVTTKVLIEKPCIWSSK